jgi:hypothetical protein
MRTTCHVLLKSLPLLVVCAWFGCDASSKRAQPRVASGSGSSSGGLATATTSANAATVDKTNTGKTSAISERCLAGDDEACDVVLSGIPHSEGGDWVGATEAMCNVGASSYCSTNDKAALTQWRAGCDRGSYMACKAANVLQDIIEKQSLDEPALPRLKQISDWCLSGPSPRSLAACADLAVNITSTEADRSAAYGLLNQACARKDTGGCAVVVTVHTGLLRHADLAFFSEAEHSFARNLVQRYASEYNATLTHLAQSCEHSDWAACGFCGDRRRGYLTHDGEYVDQAVREAALSPATRKYCDAQWLVGAQQFRRTLLSKK